MKTKIKKNEYYININQPNHTKSEIIPRKKIEKMKSESKKRLRLIQHKNDFEFMRNQISKKNKIINKNRKNYVEIEINQTDKKTSKEKTTNDNNFKTNIENQRTISKILTKMKKSLSYIDIEKIKNKNSLSKVKSSSYCRVNRHNISLENSLIQKSNLISNLNNNNFTINNDNYTINNDNNTQQKLSNSNIKFNPNSKYQLKVINSLKTNHYIRKNKKINIKPRFITVNKNKKLNNINNTIQVNTKKYNNYNNENLNYFSDSELNYETNINYNTNKNKQIEEMQLDIPLEDKHRPTASNYINFQTLDSCYNKKLLKNYYSLFNTDKKTKNHVNIINEYKNISLPKKKIILDKKKNYLYHSDHIKNKKQQNSVERATYLKTYSPFYKDNNKFQKIIYKHKSINNYISNENSPFFYQKEQNYTTTLNINNANTYDEDTGFFDLTKSSNYSFNINRFDPNSPFRVYTKQKPKKCLASSEILNFELNRKLFNNNILQMKTKKVNNTNVFIEKYYNFAIKKKQINKKTSYNKNYYYMSKYSEYLFNVILKPQIKVCYLSKLFYTVMQLPISKKCYYNKKNILKMKNIPMTQNIYYNVLINKVNINHNITNENKKNHRITQNAQIKYNKPIIITKNSSIINKNRTINQNNKIIFLLNILSYSNYNEVSKSLISIVSLNKKNINLLINKILKFAIISDKKYNILYVDICHQIYQKLLKIEENEYFKGLLVKESKLKFDELIKNEESNYLLSFINFVSELIKTNLFTEDNGFYYIEKLFIEYYKNNFNTPIKDIPQISLSAIILLEEIGKIANRNKNKKNIEYVNNFIKIDLKDILRNSDKNGFIKNKINKLIDLYKNNWVINKKDILSYYLDYNVKNEFLNKNKENNLTKNICNIEINNFNIILVIKKDLEQFTMFLTKNNNSNLYDWSKISEIITKEKCDFTEIIFSYIEISIDTVNNSEQIDINNQYIRSVINLYSVKQLDNQKELIHNKMVKLFLNIKNICIENNFMLGIMGLLLFSLIEKNFYFFEDLNFFNKKENGEVIIIAKCCKFALSKFENKKYFNEIEKLKIFSNRTFRENIEK